MAYIDYVIADAIRFIAGTRHSICSGDVDILGKQFYEFTESLDFIPEDELPEDLYRWQITDRWEQFVSHYVFTRFRCGIGFHDSGSWECSNELMQAIRKQKTLEFITVEDDLFPDQTLVEIHGLRI